MNMTHRCPGAAGLLREPAERSFQEGDDKHPEKQKQQGISRLPAAPGGCPPKTTNPNLNK